MAKNAVEFVTMLLLKHYEEHSHIPLVHAERKELVDIIKHFYPEEDFVRVMSKAHKKT